MNLYEINNAILDCVDEETGEILDVERLAELQIERETKLENVALWIKNLNADINAYKAEKDAFTERENKAKAKVESLKNYLAGALNGNPMNTSKVAVTFRKSEAVQIDDESLIPQEFTRSKTVVEPDKTAIKNAIKNTNAVIPGASIVVNQNIQIK